MECRTVYDMVSDGLVNIGQHSHFILCGSPLHCIYTDMSAAALLLMTLARLVASQPARHLMS